MFLLQYLFFYYFLLEILKIGNEIALLSESLYMRA